MIPIHAAKVDTGRDAISQSEQDAHACGANDDVSQRITPGVLIFIHVYKSQINIKLPLSTP